MAAKADRVALKADRVALKADRVALKADRVALKADRVALKADRVALESLRRSLVPAALPLVTGVERPPVTCLAAGWQAATGTTYSPCHRGSCMS